MQQSTTPVWNVSFILKATFVMEQAGFTDEVIVQPVQVSAPSEAGAVTQLLMDDDIHGKLAQYEKDKGRIVPIVICVANP